jgi:hypothetical protein
VREAMGAHNSVAEDAVGRIGLRVSTSLRLPARHLYLAARDAHHELHRLTLCWTAFESELLKCDRCIQGGTRIELKEGLDVIVAP